MSYPSLLFTGKASGKRVELHVFSDVKLDLLFSGEAIGAMRLLCPAEDIPVRQALFRYLLESGETRARFASLAGIAGHIHRLREALLNVKCENERHYVFVGLMAAVGDFYEAAAAGPDEGGRLLRRFTEWFRAAGADQALFAEARRLREEAHRAERESFRAEGDNLWLRLEYGESYVERLRQSAKALGLPEPSERREVAIRLDARMVNALARLHPAAFLAFKEFHAAYASRFDESILSYRYELNFYLEALRLLDKIAAAGLPLCWPETAGEKRVSMRGLRDVSLLAKDVTGIVPNDAAFTGEEPFFFLTGANGGGKTTYLRALAIAMLLYRSGCPVCAEEASLWPAENIFTHFPQDERFEADGRYADEQRRVGEILAAHGGNALILLNETYSTTNETLAVESTVKLAKELKTSGCLGLYITHQHGLEEAGLPFLSVLVDEGDENRRTYRIARRKEASNSYAADILRRYGLDRAALEARFGGERQGIRA